MSAERKEKEKRTRLSLGPRYPRGEPIPRVIAEPTSFRYRPGIGRQHPTGDSR